VGGLVKVLLQRVNEASVTVGGQMAGKIKCGLVAFVGIAKDDTERDVIYVADKVINLRIFEDEKSKFNLSIRDVGGSILIVSQFTLMADTRKGRRPSFVHAAPPDMAELMINLFIEFIREKEIGVETGRFQTHMLVKIFNDGPVTVMLDSRDKIT
jgi:D-tyrosyl-tRNA(Tyr) deacylase